MDQATHNKIVSFIWGIADDVLRDLFKRGKYPDVILPMCVIRRMDAVLEPTKKAVLDTKVALIRELLVTPEADLDKTFKAHLADLDDLFFEVLTQNLQDAQQRNEAQAFAQLQKIGDAAMRAIQGTQPPEVRFVNTLLQIEYPNQTKELLERNKQVLGPEFIAWMEGLEGELRESGRAETADRLVLVIGQAKELAGLKVSLK